MAFEWPWQYSFPPFFTLQPNLETRKKQLEAWCSLILTFCKQKKIFTFDVTEAQTSELFCNKSINRKLSNDDLIFVLETLRKRGNLHWRDKKKTHFTIIWRTPDQWGTILYEWAQRTARLNTVCTIFELTNGVETTEEEFYGLDDSLILASLKTLEASRKAEIIDRDGVKFFP
ncbi:vacuolar protein-sorting-associated protein 25-like [Symsagittifera roscoffensis]|uniref:vacuolar protein-sorting-associated protein 25-like n=1 Tax=Symsagittifera roscoffensis TaxID=84072 RepID=UPI00307CA256